MKYIVRAKNSRNSKTHCACTLIIKKNLPLFLMMVWNVEIKTSTLTKKLIEMFVLITLICEKEKDLYDALLKIEIIIICIIEELYKTRSRVVIWFKIKLNRLWKLDVIYQISVYFNGCRVTLLKEIHRNTN